MAPGFADAPQPGSLDPQAGSLDPQAGSLDPQALPQRQAARVILLDPGNRVLLMRYDDGPPNGRHWATPGGGLEPGESYEQAALRELAEETGWTDIALRKEVHQRSHTMEWAGTLVHQHERLYLARTDQPTRPITGVDAMHSADGIADWRWWTIDELTSTTDKIWPAVLAELIRAELARG
jgi:ADP-ribose pyrophosphatase YjhB (NUDIX family)